MTAVKIMRRITNRTPPEGGACWPHPDIFTKAIDVLAKGRRTDERHPKVMAAKAICSRCPVREACLAWALDIADPHGVLGGMTARERGRVVKARLR